LLENPEGLKDIGENARRKVEREHNWDEVARKAEEVYRNRKLVW